MTKPQARQVVGFVVVAILAQPCLMTMAALPVVMAQPAPAVQVQVLPQKLVLAPDGMGSADVIARSSEEPIGDLALSSVPVPGLKVDTTLVESTQTTRRWRTTVSRTGRSADAEVVFTAARGGVTVASATLAVTVTKEPAPAEILELSVSTELSELQEAKAQEIVVVARNTSSLPVTVERVLGQVGPDVRICHLKDGTTDSEAQSCNAGQEEAPRRTVDRNGVALYWFRIEATDRTRVGAHQALFTAAASYTDERGVRAQADAVVKHAFTYSVLGESDFLTAIGVPSFLVLPGFLIVMAYRIPARRAGGRGVELPPLDVSTAEFLAISVSLSVLAIPLFWLVTGLTGTARTYLTGYGVRDLLTVWIGSVVVGFAAFAIPWATTTIRTRLRVPSATDDPRTLLRRLARMGAPLVLPQFSFSTAHNTTRQGFRVDAGDPEFVWCVPAIRCTVSSTASDERKRAVQASLTGSPRDLLTVLERKNDVQLSWEAGGQPVKIAVADIAGEHPARPLVVQWLGGEAQ